MALPAITQAGTAKLRPTMPPRRRPKRGDNEHDERMDVEGLDPESGLHEVCSTRFARRCRPLSAGRGGGHGHPVPSSWIAPPAVRGLRELVRDRAKLVKLCLTRSALRSAETRHRVNPVVVVRLRHCLVDSEMLEVPRRCRAG
jgi:hypothetical protein